MRAARNESSRRLWRHRRRRRRVGVTGRVRQPRSQSRTGIKQEASKKVEAESRSETWPVMALNAPRVSALYLPETGLLKTVPGVDSLRLSHPLSQAPMLLTAGLRAPELGRDHFF